MIRRASSSIERPFSAARTRSLPFVESLNFRIVRDAISISPILTSKIALIALQSTSEYKPQPYCDRHHRYRHQRNPPPTAGARLGTPDFSDRFGIETNPLLTHPVEFGRKPPGPTDEAP